MHACVDVDYRNATAVAACLTFHDCTDGAAADSRISVVSNVEPYVPGQFYRREMPCILRVIEPVVRDLEVLVIDGYVWLEDVTTPGLGAHLYQALDSRIPVVGVAKERYRSAKAAEVIRGASRRPLYVTAAGLPVDAAADFVRRMHGDHRIPTLLQRVDAMCRAHRLDASTPNP